MLPTATVPVKSPLASKINWAQVAAALATFATALIGAAHLPGSQAAEYTAAVAGVGQLATIILRSFFSASVTSGSVGVS